MIAARACRLRSTRAQRHEHAGAALRHGWDVVKQSESICHGKEKVPQILV